MLSLSQQREREEAAARVFEFMRRWKLSLTDLTEIGGEDLRSPDHRQARKGPSR